MFNIKKTTLPNNLRIITVPMKSTEAVSVFIKFKAGSRYETKSNSGIAHFLEHMFFKGGDRYPTPKSVAEAVDAVGGSFNAFTGHESVGYYIKVAKENIELAFDVLSDMLLNSKFKQEDIDREKGVIVEEYNMYQDNPRSILYDEFEKMMYGDHPLGRKILGDMKFIKKATKKDFLDYRKSLYTTPNMVVGVAGNTTVAEVKRLVNKYLPLEKATKKNVATPFKLSKSPKKKVKVLFKKTEQAHLRIGIPTLGYQSPNKYALTILAVILGGGMSSRLFESVRERHGLAYYVGAMFSYYPEVGSFEIGAGVNINKIDLAIRLIMDELKALTKTPVPVKELKKAQQSLIGRLVLSLESSDSVASRATSRELVYNRVESIAEIKKAYKAVTPEKIQKLAKDIFKDEKLVLAVIGPYRSDKKIKAACQL